MTAFQFRMPAGIPGDISRSESMIVEAQTITATGVTGTPTKFGIPVVMDATTKNMRAMAAGDKAVDVYGLLVRDYPVNSLSNDPLGTSTPFSIAGAACSVLVRGYMSVKLAAGSATKNGQVYVRLVANGGALIGDLEATADMTAVSAIKGGGNTGNATMSAITVDATVAKAGVYKVRMLTATTFNVQDPDGMFISNGATGTAYSDDVGFTMTVGGTPMVAGDGFDITVSANNAPMARTVFMGPADSAGNTEIRYRVN